MSTQFRLPDLGKNLFADAMTSLPLSPRETPPQSEEADDRINILAQQLVRTNELVLELNRQITHLRERQSAFSTDDVRTLQGFALAVTENTRILGAVLSRVTILEERLPRSLPQ